MHILIVTADFSATGTDPWLLDDLASELIGQGHTVHVVVQSPTTPRKRGRSALGAAGSEVISVGTQRRPANRIAKAISYGATGLRLHVSGFRSVRNEVYDLCVFTSIAAFSYGFPSRLRRAGIARHLLFVMWDFFPIHQLEIGRIRKSPVSRVLKGIEWLAIRRADTIATMSTANERFFREYHRKVSAPIVHVPPWAAAPPLSKQVKRAVVTAIFGGQLAQGRGLDTLLDAAAILLARGLELEILVAGDGTERNRLELRARTQGLSNVTFLGPRPRAEYRDLLRTAHMGIAITVPGITPPSFPSKIVEYCAYGIPTVACLEDSSDAGDHLVRYQAGLVVPAGSATALADALALLIDEHKAGTLERRATAARELFDNEFSVTRAAARFVDSALEVKRH